MSSKPIRIRLTELPRGPAAVARKAREAGRNGDGWYVEATMVSDGRKTRLALRGMRHSHRAAFVATWIDGRASLFLVGVYPHLRRCSAAELKRWLTLDSEAER